MTKELAIIIPVFNAEHCLKQTVDRVVNVLRKINVSYEIILINDASYDRSWSIIRELKSSNENITGVNFNKNYGQHNALHCGIKIANANYIVTIDDDLEQSPEDIILLYQNIKASGNDLVYGMPTNIKKGFLRILITKIYKRISQIENKKAGEGSSFRIFNKGLKDNLLNHDGSLFFIDEIVLWYTDCIGYEKITFNKSLKKVSGYRLGTLFTLSLRVMTLSSTMPLKILRIIGFYIYIISILMAMYFIFRKIVYKTPMGYTSLMVTILFSTGIITFSLGIIGEYLGNLISLSNKKPSYSIKEKI
ncbi:MAG TPA: glycosyltransferase [Bacteroidia bacterium]|nr:glycosyltransferase [Bacteroidia bacterium]